MAKHILYDVSWVVNGADLSDHTESVSVEIEVNEQFSSAMGELQDYNMPGTIKYSNPQATMYQDYATSKTYQTIKTLALARTVFNLVCKPTSSSASATNPQYTIPVFVKKTPVMTGKRGDRHMAPVEFSIAGTVSISEP